MAKGGPCKGINTVQGRKTETSSINFANCWVKVQILNKNVCFSIFWLFVSSSMQSHAESFYDYAQKPLLEPKWDTIAKTSKFGPVRTCPGRQVLAVGSPALSLLSPALSLKTKLACSDTYIWSKGTYNCGIQPGSGQGTLANVFLKKGTGLILKTS